MVEEIAQETCPVRLDSGGKSGISSTQALSPDSILPLYDEELTKPVAASLRRLGVQDAAAR